MNLLLFPFRSWHNSVIFIGLIPGMAYIPLWIYLITERVIMGSSSVFLNVCFIALGLYQFFTQKNELLMLKSDSEDQIVGYALIIGAVVMYFIFFESYSLQAITWSTALIGVSLATFGNQFIRNYWVSILLIFFGLLPKYLDLGYTLGKVLIPNYALERLMASISGLVLSLMGQPAIVAGNVIQIGSKGVDIADGCSGFSMAMILAGVSLVMGIFYRLRPRKLGLLILLGVVIALVINVPRIILLTYSVVYWGDDAFRFWHTGLGSQLISGAMFTVFYYVSMAICKRENGSKSSLCKL
ncbi:cyanoexosortase C [Nodosilinea sp. E11]|uniref:cyanoexosortase C n=1 Tax=Nodosilinea sp. E11 TaxID=3037479 RepID=UPI0029352CB8|nr:cyanoexosortase C [Nodosilinea sp. E11]WOD39261.1 cyanoexosortase C [Nodosilinea sp. E11]